MSDLCSFSLVVLDDECCSEQEAAAIKSRFSVIQAETGELENDLLARIMGALDLKSPFDSTKLACAFTAMFAWTMSGIAEALSCCSGM